MQQTFLSYKMHMMKDDKKSVKVSIIFFYNPCYHRNLTFIKIKFDHANY